MSETAPLLALIEIAASYGESQVLRGVSLTLSRSEVVCLIGTNGAGKTTTLRVAAGLLDPDRGEVHLDGEDLTRVPGHARVERGLSMSPEGRQLFPKLTVQENLLLGSYSRRGRAARARMLERVLTLFPRVAERRNQLSGLMSGGEQQMVAIARALMADPKVLMLDEPSLGLAPKIVWEVYDAITEIARSGMSILLVEQNAEAALSIASRGYVLVHGRIALSADNAQLRRAGLLRELMLGDASARSEVAPC